MAKTTPLSRAHRWLRSYLADHAGMAKGYSNPVHTCMQMEVDCSNFDSTKGRVGNVWLTFDISLMCYTTSAPSLVFMANRCGPEARSTCDGPIELDYPIMESFRKDFSTDFSEADLEELKQLVKAKWQAYAAEYHKTVDKYTL